MNKGTEDVQLLVFGKEVAQRGLPRDQPLLGVGCVKLVVRPSVVLTKRTGTVEVDSGRTSSNICRGPRGDMGTLARVKGK